MNYAECVYFIQLQAFLCNSTHPYRKSDDRTVNPPKSGRAETQKTLNMSQVPMPSDQGAKYPVRGTLFSLLYIYIYIVGGAASRTTP